MNIDKIQAEIKALRESTNEIMHTARAVNGEAFSKVLEQSHVAASIISLFSMLTDNPQIRDVVVNLVGRMLCDYSEAMKISDEQFMEIIRLTEVMHSKTLKAEKNVMKGMS